MILFIRSVKSTFFVSFLLTSFLLNQGMPLFAQHAEVAKDEVVLLSITELSNSIEESDRWIKSLDKSLEISTDLSNLYEVLPVRKDSLMKILNAYGGDYYADLSFQQVESMKAEMEKYSDKVNNYKDILAKRLDLLQTNIGALERKKATWIDIEKKYREDVAINSVLKERLKPLMDKLNEAIKYYQGVQKQELNYFNDLNVVFNLIIEKQDLLKDREEELRNVILQENVPIWQLSKVETDSTTLLQRFNKGLGEREVLVGKYVEYHYQLMIIHLLIVIGLVLFLIGIKKKAMMAFEKHEAQGLGTFMHKPIAAAYVMSYLFVGAVYDTFPKVILEIVLVSLVVPVAYLVLDFINSYQKKAMTAFLILFTIYLGLEIFPLLTPFGRFLSLIYETALLTSLWFLRANSKNLALEETTEKVVRFILTLFVLTTALSIFFGIVGSVQLSHLLLTGTVFSIGIGIVLLLWSHILKSFAVLFFELPFIASIQAVVLKRKKLEKRAFQVTGAYLFFMYLEGTAHQFSIRDLIVQTWNDVVGHAYAFGELEVSFQDFINFFLVLFITVFLARFLKYMFGREILTKVKMERGMPNAIATTIYYFVVVIGLFLAAASTGIQWSKVNLALGAIGVGIGFGLQNVIYNFISGLILIYERPIQVGDTIEFGEMMGPVTEIGIRSSKVLTYEGAEVIVPNGNLISNEVINWTYTDQLKRRELIIKTTYDADPNEVIETIKSILIEVENVLSDPAPSAFFTGFGDGTLDFRVLFWTHLDVGLSTGSRAAIAIYNGLRSAGYEMPLSKSAVVVEQRGKGSKGVWN